MAGKCCGEPELPKVMSDVTLVDPRIINPEFVNTKFTTDCKGRNVTEDTPVVSCMNITKDGILASKDAGNVVKVGSDGGVFLDGNKAATDPKTVAVVDAAGNIGMPISKDAGNEARKGSDGGLYVPESVTTITGKDGNKHASGTCIPSCAQTQDMINASIPDIAGIARTVVHDTVNFKNCAGQEHALDATIPSCAELTDAIRTAIARGLINPAELISNDAGNAIKIGSDGKLFVDASSSSGGGSTYGRIIYVTTDSFTANIHGDIRSYEFEVSGLEPNTSYTIKVDHPNDLNDGYHDEWRGFTTNSTGAYRGGATAVAGPSDTRIQASYSDLFKSGTTTRVGSLTITHEDRTKPDTGGDS